MAEVLRSFDEPISHSDGMFRARVVARAAEDGMWEAWMEFVPTGPAGTNVVVSAAESRQAEREQLQYWAEGLTVVYAEGSLERALHPTVVRTRVAELPVSDRPAARVASAPPYWTGPEPVLNPFDVGERSLDILRQELHAFDRPRLMNIIDAFLLNPGGEDITMMSLDQLITFIVVAVDVQLGQRSS